jgi:ribosome-binding protein aMBF1 (putative translation factor)
MNAKQIITILNRVKTPKGLIRASKQLPGIGFSFEDNKAFLRRDLRHEISSAIEGEGISIRELAHCVGCDYSNLVAYLNNRRTLPEKYLERILGILLSRE